MSTVAKVALKKDIPPGKCLGVTIGHNKQIAVFNIGGKYYAIDDACTHASGPLSEGECNANIVTCPWHGATFDITTGKATGAPAFEDLRTYEVKVEGEEIKVVIP